MQPHLLSQGHRKTPLDHRVDSRYTQQQTPRQVRQGPIEEGSLELAGTHT